MTVERTHDLLSATVCNLVMAGLLVALLLDRCNLLMLRPLLAVLAGLVEKLTLSVVTGEEQEKSLFRIVVDLRICHDAFVDILERSYVVRLRTAESHTVSMVSTSCNKHPDMTILVDLDRRIIMRVVNSILPLVKHKTRFLKHASVVVITSDHALKIALAILRCSAINEESLVDLLCVCRHRNVLHRVRAKTSGILVTIFLHLSQSEPDSPVAIHGLVNMRQRLRFLCNSSDCYQQNHHSVK